MQTSLILLLVFGKGFISPISIHNLTRLHTLNVDISDERKWFYSKRARSKRYSAQTITDADYADYIVLYLYPSQIPAALSGADRKRHGHYVNADKTEYICLNHKGDISTLSRGSMKLIDKFTYLGSSISSTENDINIQQAKVWIAIDSLLNI